MRLELTEREHELLLDFIQAEQETRHDPEVDAFLEVMQRKLAPRFDWPHRETIAGWEVLLANDRVTPDEPDAWKYKVVAPYSTWSLGYDTFEQAHDAAEIDARSSPPSGWATSVPR